MSDMTPHIEAVSKFSREAQNELVTISVREAINDIDNFPQHYLMGALAIVSLRPRNWPLDADKAYEIAVVHVLLKKSPNKTLLTAIYQCVAEQTEFSEVAEELRKAESLWRE